MNKMIVPALSALLLLSACATTSPQPTPTTVLGAYDNAIYQGAVYRPENLRQLLPAVPDPTTGLVTVATLTNSKFPWSTGWQNLTYSPWVTVSPEVQQKCTAFKGNDVTMYLRQIIGLKPDQDVTQFIVMQVKPESLFRPTPDPRIDTTYPCLDPVAKKDCNVFPKDVDPLHKQWMAETFLTVQIPNGYPWTHLGYTYNWGPGDRYGASEYLVRNNAYVNVTAVTPIASYCGR